ncbi:hypothetical protein KDA_24520 [Dictyobacter alpinus]|uniref:Uncharacterized protein n=1 Tax=Dictyobacter alpinus TaxID=2014873 RepID=A0A402B6J4_9CHLR|nr:hypothetical protein KDA_24520 [Dictyobacter alpinus]
MRHHDHVPVVTALSGRLPPAAAWWPSLLSTRFLLSGSLPLRGAQKGPSPERIVGDLSLGEVITMGEPNRPDIGPPRCGGWQVTAEGHSYVGLVL